jgi:hypothetical protein
MMPWAGKLQWLNGSWSWFQEADRLTEQPATVGSSREACFLLQVTAFLRLKRDPRALIYIANFFDCGLHGLFTRLLALGCLLL